MSQYPDPIKLINQWIEAEYLDVGYQGRIGPWPDDPDGGVLRMAKALLRIAELSGQAHDHPHSVVFRSLLRQILREELTSSMVC
jgi:hypothetical protein